MIENAKMLSFNENGDERGKLVVIEGFKDIPFDVKRIFYIYGSDRDVVRGCHANRETEFVLINMRGSLKVKVRTRMIENIYVLDRPHKGVYLPRLAWKEMYDFSNDSMLLCLASTHYDPSEYIKDFDKYLIEIENGE
jgi:dTDP-4-dehydrorhamnose 3,5-epimerase-like enzyme